MLMYKIPAIESVNNIKRKCDTVPTNSNDTMPVSYTHLKVTYKNEISTPINGGWRYNYGNMFYVKLVKQFLTQRGGDALGSDVQNRIAEIARNSGSYGIPATGGLCETWVEAVYRKAGVSINNICCAGKNRSLYTCLLYTSRCV